MTQLCLIKVYIPKIYITEVLWPEFNETEFLKAIIDYQSRNRRFGGIESISKESINSSFFHR